MTLTKEKYEIFLQLKKEIEAEALVWVERHALAYGCTANEAKNLDCVTYFNEDSITVEGEEHLPRGGYEEYSHFIETSFLFSDNKEELLTNIAAEVLDIKIKQEQEKAERYAAQEKAEDLAQLERLKKKYENKN